MENHPWVEDDTTLLHGVRLMDQSLMICCLQERHSWSLSQALCIHSTLERVLSLPQCVWLPGQFVSVCGGVYV